MRCLALLLLLVLAPGAEDPSLVGTRGDWRSWRIEGVPGISATALAIRLQRNGAIRHHTIAYAPVETLSTVLQAGVRDFLLSSGHARPILSSRIEADGIAISATAGPALRLGRITIHGFAAEPILAELVGTGYPAPVVIPATATRGEIVVKKEHPFLIPNDHSPADFRDELRTQIEKKVASLLLDHGHRSPTVTARHEPADDGTADLRIDIVPGPRCTIAALTLDGLDAAQLPGLLPDLVGQPLSAARLDRLQLELMATGRFLHIASDQHVDASTARIGFRTRPVLAGVTATSALRPELLAVRHLCDRLNRWGIDPGTTAARVAINTRRLSATVAISPQPLRVSAVFAIPGRSDSALSISGTHCSCRSGSHARIVPMELHAALKLVHFGIPELPGQQESSSDKTKFGISLETSSGRDVRSNVAFEPGALIYSLIEAGGPPRDVAISGSWIRIHSRTASASFDIHARTDALEGTCDIATAQGIGIAISFGNHVRELTPIAAEDGTLTRLVPSLFASLHGLMADSEPQQADIAGMRLPLALLGSLLVTIYAEAGTPADWTIPTRTIADPQSLHRMIPWMLSSSLADWSAWAFNHGAWPATLPLLMVHTVEHQRVPMDLLRRYAQDPQVGPLGLLAAAEVVRWADLPPALSMAFAKRSLEREDAFPADITALMPVWKALAELSRDAPMREMIVGLFQQPAPTPAEITALSQRLDDALSAAATAEQRGSVMTEWLWAQGLKRQLQQRAAFIFSEQAVKGR